MYAAYTARNSICLGGSWMDELENNTPPRLELVTMNLAIETLRMALLLR